MIKILFACLLTLGTECMASETNENTSDREVKQMTNEDSPLKYNDIPFKEREPKSLSQSIAKRSHRDVIDFQADGVGHSDSDGLGGGFEGD